MTTTSTDRRKGVNIGAAVKVPCKAATTANITLSGEQTVDGVALVTGDRCLVKDQTDGTENGIYEVDTSAWQRTKDWDGDTEVKKGTLIFVHSGSTNQGWWYVSTADTITIGTTSVTIAQASTVLAVVSAFVQTVLDDADGAAVISTLVASATAPTARSTLGIPAYINVKDYGATGDGVTNDTTSITNAINAANTADTGTTAATLVFPDGVYLVTPGSLPTINSNISGPGAMIKSASSADTVIISFDDVAHGRYIDLFAIVGPNFGTTWQTSTEQHGIGIQVLRGEHSRIHIQKFEGLFVAVDFAGQVNERHIGECVVRIHSVLHNNYGVNLNAGDSQCEANRFEIAYFHNNLVNVQLRNYGSGANSLCANNHFDILVMEFPTAGGTGFDLSGDVPGQTLANTFIVRENISPNATATVITCFANTGPNYFKLSDFDFSKINTFSTQIFDGSAEHNHPGDTLFKLRSVTWGDDAPSGAGVYWQIGSVRYNRANSSPRGWKCTLSGSPGTWQPFGGETKTESTATSITPNGASILGSTIPKVFTLLSPVVGVLDKTVACSCGSSDAYQYMKIASGNFMTSAGSSFTVAQFSTAGQCLSLVALSTNYWLVRGNMGAVGFSTST